MPIPGMELADQVAKKKPELREMMRGRSKSRFITVDGVKFLVRRGGPRNNFIMVSPADPKRSSPVLNFALDERVEEKENERKAGRRMVGEKIPQYIKKQIKRGDS